MQRPYTVSRANVRPDNRDPSLVAAYDMTQETAGIIKDISGNGSDGIIYGSPIPVSTPLGRGLQFNGLGSNLRVPNLTSYLNNRTEYTMSCWVYMTELQFLKNIMGGWNSQSQNIRTGADGKIIFRCTTTTSTYQASAISLIMGWIHIVAVLSNNNIKLYINGVLQETTSTVGATVSVDHFNIGNMNNRTDSIYSFDGTILAPQLFTEGKDATWVAEQYKQGRGAAWSTNPVRETGTITSGFIGDSPFQIGSGSFKVAKDSIKANNLVPNSQFALWTDPTVPDNFTKIATHNATNYVVKDSTYGGLKVVSDGTLTGVSIPIFPLATPVYVQAKVTVTTGGIQLFSGSTLIGSFNTTGTYMIRVSVVNATLNIYRLGVTNAVLNSIKIFTEDLDATVIECVAEGYTYLPTSLTTQDPTASAYGSWNLTMIKNSSPNATVFSIISTEPRYTTVTNNGYVIYQVAAGNFYLGRVDNGIVTTVIGTATAVFPLNIAYTFEIKRSNAGLFTVKIINNATGQQIATITGTDNTYTTSKYMGALPRTGDKLALGSPSGAYSIVKRLLP